MNRREALKALLMAVTPSPIFVAEPSVSTLIGTGSPGDSDQQVNNPYGLVVGPDRALYFCDLDNQRIRRLDMRTRRTTVVAGNGQRRYNGDGGAATAASLNMPHEIQFDSGGNLYIAERDNHVIRRVDAKTRVISTFAGTGVAGFSGDGGPSARAQLRQPHSIALDRRAGCSSAISGTIVFDKCIFPAGRSTRMRVPADDNRLRMGRLFKGRR